MAATITKRPVTKPYQTSLRVSEKTAAEVDEIRDLLGIEVKFAAIVESGITAYRDKLKKERRK